MIKIIIKLLIVFVSATAGLMAQTKLNNQGILSVQGITGTLAAIDNNATGELINDGDFYVYNHYNNDGIVTFSSGISAGITRVNGIYGFQNISGTVPMDLFDVEFNNNLLQPAFHLSNQINVFNESNFLQGIVDNDNHGGLFVFEDNAFHNSTSDQSHVDGYVRKNGNQFFQFPIGDGGQFRYASISAPQLSIDAFTGKYFWENSNPLYPLENRTGIITLIDNAEYWTVDKTAGNSNIFLTLSWDEDTTPTEIYAAPLEDIHIVRWDVSENRWVDEGGVADINTKEVTTVIDPLTQYGVFTLARVRSEDILPCGGRGVVIYNAISANEDGRNDYFIIDGIEECPQNTVEIYNRWGVKVYETTSYNTNGNVFNGYSDGRVTIAKNEKLPVGTYFYHINFLDENGGIRTKKAGYLYISL
ncbi:MAG TPA: gliding motility-associated C-terminal domain-containing protein [Flavobacterium sp.]|uniref:gliding motility-associated C-terminal domain-containing protein n=1 Tax=unclassified Flavobacterium TaxID=196869 RepID=UPI0025C73B04|nr:MULTISPECIES: gliding motility-associated C-terminal domain-containing protein [unclassified Flavobacterium]HRE77536.1 gliding motility-associated C-terminal domain-containing protein [Flavobacterium sp.]